jgi:hypothetical protein
MKQVLSLLTFGIGALFCVLDYPQADCRHCGFGAGQARPVQHESSAFARLPLPDTCYSIVA